MSLVAPTLEAFFTSRLIGERHASPRTVAAYRDTCCLLVRFAARTTRCEASRLDFAHLDAPLIGAFLDYLENERGNSVRTRNARLAAIHSLFRFAARYHPEHAGSIERVLAIPHKRCERALVSFLTKDEVTALLDSPDRSTWIGRRDHALLTLAVQTGLRVGELIGLGCSDVVLASGPRPLPRERSQGTHHTPDPTRCRDPQGLARRTPWRTSRAALPQPSRRTTQRRCRAVPRRQVRRPGHRSVPLNRRQTRHPTRPQALHAMFLREAGVDISTIALWLGHENIATAQIYLHADLAIKEKALALAAPPEPHPDDTGLPTSSSPSSKLSDYAEHPAQNPFSHKPSWHRLGITRTSA